MDWWLYLVVVLAGAAAGFINTLAGSGSLLTLPLLIFMGLPANVANGTNRIGILLQSVVAVGSFKQNKVFEWRDGIWLTIPAGIGALVGAWVAVDLNEQLMNRIIGGLLVFMFFVILLKPEKWLGNSNSENPIKVTPLRILIFLLIGFYGGFIQAGVGFFLLTGLVLGAGMNLLKANAIKVLVTLVFTVLALVIFIVNNQVDYLLGLILGAGNMLGAWIATRVAVKQGTKFIRWFLLGTVLVFALKLLVW
ncbi:MAG: sulfite exporter TauE/SafE family protein [Bacteroidales bacterium]